ncbi:MAG: transposase [Enterobacteriaceae bacterium]|nr:transposase [Enterobacteriaceae bacterium]
MAKSRFTEEQIAYFLQQSKNGVPDKVLCETCGFSISTLRRWRELHARGVDSELKQLESTAQMVFIGVFIVALLLALAFPKPTGALVIPPYLIYCVSYIRRFRKISAKHIQEVNTFLSRSGKGGHNVFYTLSWTFIILFVFTIGYGIVQLT